MNTFFYAPTKIAPNVNYNEVLPDIVDGRTWSLVTSLYWRERNIADRLNKIMGAPIAIVDDVPSNPSERYVSNLSNDPCGEVIVAIGGGSVMDAAKGLATVRSLGDKTEQLADHLRTGADLHFETPPPLIVCIPTTSGTGSEVTRWATIWRDDQDNDASTDPLKFSLTDPHLYPTHAILDPNLCKSMPADITLSSGLDAVSHAMESVWNKNHTPYSDLMAREALKILHSNLAVVLREPDNVDARAKVQFAATLSGLAMGTTQTALCHSISYPFTALLDMAHGFACSFTLPAVAAYNLEVDAERLQPIANGLGLASPSYISDHLTIWFKELGLHNYISGYDCAAKMDILAKHMQNPARAANNIRPSNNQTAEQLVCESLERFV